MKNQSLFSDSFVFSNVNLNKYHYTDSRAGAGSHFFGLMKKGKCEIVTKDSHLYINPGDVFYIPYQCQYQSYWYGKDDIQFNSLGFHFWVIPDNHKYGAQIIPSNSDIKTLFTQISLDNHVSPYTVGIFFTLTALLISNMSYEVLNETDIIIKKSRKFLSQNPYLQNHELAKLCGISQSGLYATFKMNSTITPNQLRMKILIEKAKELLTTTNLPIEEISSLLKFSSSSYFRKIFKKETGLTPREVRINSQI